MTVPLMLGKEYYVLEPSKENKMEVCCDDAATDDLLDEDDYLDPTTILKLHFHKKRVKQPVLFDYLQMDISPIISNRIKGILELFDYSPAMQYVKSVIRFGDKIFEDCFYLHILNYISCVDENQSNVKRNNYGDIRAFEKLILLDDPLKRKSLQQRQIFRLEEDPSTILFHESVVEAVMKLEPTGLTFYPVDKWHSFITALPG